MKNWSDMALLKEAYKINNSCFDESANNKMLSIVEELFKRLMLEQMQLNELEETTLKQTRRVKNDYKKSMQ